ncbi:N,N-dimethylformamidase beta subunit family domain-containing protein [Paremcibacter congregatus]|uniref:N,N-dimethylformamidase beta subunit-like C-terminal domain-containing protein n=1 Tax=Paremcibacter congregatus TaxID=2043170 RepID=A0A2G4YWM4_9PROT|nr:N,N-dimethylformamidase beta subunit family domain-containing protein [Paremcibacter congregatus]PHZ85106.1 hypothetical protein CRD36_08475 [Paremcibacter congregatus]PHZ86738.1 hypothetical protein CRD36_00110 [Paremcibacter congregatus]QDE26262.1 twin-arginine translocation signal domain-containing protein [Paremcibacter congregatus]QDE27636.1 twin-arginine translocation signal domain-containing protein [Paremcibacter congregatus]
MTDDLNRSKPKDSAPESKSPGRRDFMKASGAAGIMAAVGSRIFAGEAKAETAVVSSAAGNYWEQEDWRALPKRTILGYCWPWHARPGDTLDFKVSTYAGGPYEADLVRVIHGNIWPAQKMQKELELEAPFARQYPGRHQISAPGSCVEVPESRGLNNIKSFTVQSYVFPSLILKKGEKLHHYPDTYIGHEGLGIEETEEVIDEQTLVARWDEEAGTGWSLYLDRQGRPSFKIAGSNGKTHKIILGRPLLKKRWFLVAASYDADSGSLKISSEHIDGYFANEYAVRPQSATLALPAGAKPRQKGVLRFGATTGRKRGKYYRAPAQVLNGKLDSVRLTHGALSPKEVQEVSGLVVPKKRALKVIGFWDFGKDIGTTKVHDLSKNNLHGETINLPDRGVTGVRFDGSITEWTVKPDHYGACAFHDDDLYDAQWETDFSYKVPKGLPSGIYAVRLKHGDFIEHIPFFVAPPKGRTTSKAAYLVPTVSYSAYSNMDEHFSLNIPIARKQFDGSTKIEKDHFVHPSVAGLSPHEAAFYAKHRRELGGGVYRNHTGGGYHWHATQKVPNLNLKLAAGYTKLCMDTFLTDWFYAKGIEVDIITDDMMQAEGVDLLKNYNVILNGHHPEYYSSEMLDAVEGYLDQGGRWMYLGGNGYCWTTPFHPTLDGVVEVRKNVGGGLLFGGDYWGVQQAVNEYDGRDAGLWRSAHRPEQRTVGVGWVASPYSTQSVPYKRTEAAGDTRAAFIFAGVKGELLGSFGLSGNGAAGFEVDGASFDKGTPSHALIVARSTDFGKPWHFMLGGLEREEFAPRFAMPRADMTFFETSKGGAVFSVGSMSYIGSLSHAGYDNNISQITLNVLSRFMDKKPFRMPEG